MFWVAFKTDKKLFQRADPKPVFSQTLINVPSTKYILQLALNQFAKSPIEYEAFKGKFSNSSLKPSSSSCDL
jgi:hypothetical protein